MKFIFCLLMTVSFASKASGPHPQGIKKLTKEVQNLVKNHGAKLGGSDKKEVKRLLKDIKQIFAHNNLYLNKTTKPSAFTVFYQCGLDRSFDTYEIVVSGSNPIDMKKRAKKQCKWRVFKTLNTTTENKGFNQLRCQCGVDGAQSSYYIMGSGKTLEAAYSAVVSDCKWTPIIKKCLTVD